MVLVEKDWKGEPGDKRNTKYALSALGGTAILPVVGTAGGAAAYHYYRQSDKSKKARRESIARKKREGKSVSKMFTDPYEVDKNWKGEPGDKRNTGYAAAGIGGAALGAASINMSPKRRRIARAAFARSGRETAYAASRGAAPKAAIRQGIAAGRRTPGYRSTQRLRGGLALGGAAAGLGLYAAYRNKKKNVSKADAESAYLASRVSKMMPVEVDKGYVDVPRAAGETIYRLGRRNNAIQDMVESSDPKTAAKGRLMMRRMRAGMQRRSAKGWDTRNADEGMRRRPPRSR